MPARGMTSPPTWCSSPTSITTTPTPAWSP
jgi:hypothetical protein